MGFFDRFRTQSSPPPSFSGSTSGPEPSTPMLDFLFNSMGIDEEWSERTDNSFSWWGHELAQTVWVSDSVALGGLRVARVVSCIDVAEIEPSMKAKGAIDATNRLASLSGLAIDDSGRVTLNCSMVFNDDNKPWIQRVMALAMGLQQTEAVRVSAALQLLGGRPLRSPHTINGFRTHADSVLAAAPQFVSQYSSRPLPGPQVFEMIAFNLNSSGNVMAGAKGGQFAAQFSFGSSSSLLTAEPVSHPALGPGLLFLMRFPLSGLVDGDPGISFSEILNRRISRRVLDANSLHWVGGWCTEDDVTAQATFLPACLCEPEIVLGITMALCGQAMTIGQRLGPIVDRRPYSVTAVCNAIGVEPAHSAASMGGERP